MVPSNMYNENIKDTKKHHPPNSLGLNLTAQCCFCTYTVMIQPLSRPLHARPLLHPQVGSLR